MTLIWTLYSIAWAASASAGDGLQAAGDSGQVTCAQRVEELERDRSGVGRNQAAEERYHVIMALGATGPAAACAIEPLRLATRDDYFAARVAAVKALGRIGPRAMRAVPDLMARWNDEEVDGDVIVTALSQLGPEIIPRLIPYLDAEREPDADVPGGPHDLAARALATFGARAVPALIPALNREVARFSAALALESIGPAAETAAPALVAR